MYINRLIPCSIDLAQVSKEHHNVQFVLKEMQITDFRRMSCITPSYMNVHKHLGQRQADDRNELILYCGTSIYVQWNYSSVTVTLICE